MGTVSEILRLGVDPRAAKKGFADYSKAAKKAAADTARLKKEVRNLESELKRMAKTQSGVQVITRKTSNQLTAMAKRIAVAALAFGALRAAMSGVTLAADFGRQLSIVRALTGGMKKDIDDLAESFIDLSVATGTSMKEFGGASVILTRAGKSIDDIKNSMETLADFALVGGITVAEGADLIIRTLAQFDISFREAPRVMELMARQANSVRIDLNKLGSSMRFVGTIASSLGVSVEETAALIGVLGEKGLDASRAGTSLRGVFISFLKPSAEFQNTIANMGLSMKDVSIETLGVVKVMENLNRVGITNNEITKLVSRRQVGALTVLLKNTKGIKSNTEANKRQTGALQRQADVIRGDLRGSIDKLSTSWNKLLVSLGNSEAITSVIKILNELIETLERALAFGKVDAGKIPSIAAGIEERKKDPAKDLEFRIKLQEKFIRLIRSERKEAAKAFAKDFGIRNLGIVEATDDLNRMTEQLELFQIFASKGIKIQTLGISLDDLLSGKASLKKLISEDLDDVDANRLRVLQGKKDEGVKDDVVRGEENLERQKLKDVKRKKALDEIVEGLRSKLALESMSEDLQKDALETQDLLRDLKEKNVKLTEKETQLLFLGVQAVNKELRDRESAMEKAIEDAEALKETFREIGEVIGQSIGSALEDLIFDGKKFRDVMRALVQDVLRELFRVLVIKQIVSGIGSLVGNLSPGNLANNPVGGVGPIQRQAKGNPFSRGRVIPFVSGGTLVDRPTTFPMAGGNTGLMGEAGTEGIFPLTKKNGKLGIEASGNGSSTTIINFKVVSPNADSFKRSERQIVDRMRNAMRRTA